MRLTTFGALTRVAQPLTSTPFAPGAAGRWDIVNEA